MTERVGFKSDAYDGEPEIVGKPVLIRSADGFEHLMEFTVGKKNGKGIVAAHESVQKPAKINHLFTTGFFVEMIEDPENPALVQEAIGRIRAAIEAGKFDI